MPKIVLLCLFYLILGAKAKAQSEFAVQRIIDSLSSYNARFTQEKVYLHFDRSHYSPGDDIWFKAYVTIGNFNLLSQYSKLVNVELIGPDDELIQSIRLPLSAGITFGDFALSNTLPSGIYRIKAYTQWMRNFDKGYFFEKQFTVIDSLASTSVKEPKNNKSTLNRQKKINSSRNSKDNNNLFKIELYPESAYYSLGNSNKVTIKTTNNGHGVTTKGWLKNNEGENSIELKTDENGLGSFDFIAEDRDYFIVLKDEQGNDQSSTFTVKNTNGYGLAVNNRSETNLFLQIRLDQKEVNGQELNLLVQQKGEVFYGLVIKAQKSESVVNIPKNVLGDGIIEIVLLSADMIPLASRKIFNLSPRRSLPLEVQTDKKQYKTREKV